MQRYRYLCFALLLAVLLVAAGGSLVAGSPEEAQEKVTELEQLVQKLEENIRNRETRIKELNAEMEASGKRLQDAETALAAAGEALSEKNLVFGERVRSAYMKGGLSYLEVILAAEDFGDLISRVVYLSRILSRDAVIVAGLREEYAAWQAQKTALQAEKKNLEELQYRLEAEHKNLLAEKKQVDNLLAAAKEELEEELKKVPQAERTPVYGVVIDNHAAARPQHGLAQASVVYEYEVEGRITRYLALFADFPAKVGPVRSARLHNIQLGQENKICFVHAGGSYDNIDVLAKLDMKSVNALASGSKAFYRDSRRKAPHNLYVNLQQLKLMSPSESVTLRPAYLDREGQKATSFDITYSNTYRIGFTYVEKEGYYYRYINGKQHKDADGTAITARNIIVQYVPFYNDSRGRPTADLVGEGTIEYYCQGQKFRGTWRKENESSPTRFYFQDGREIERVYGQTWIQLVRK
ncbi:MAG TPA: DUF3048 domain-containing protein [Firmicutes bacterium]|nr:DUF3048 domain-containing protein [Bacillota bacterium]